MPEINPRERTVKIKIAYYGPPVGGKTTNLKVLHRAASADRRGEFISVNSFQDRTILFDMLPLKVAGPRGFQLRFQFLAVPGQALYSATRRAALKGVDGVVFVANSATDRWSQTLESFQELRRHLVDQQIDPRSLPMVLQYNKRDLPFATSLDIMDRDLRTRQEPAFPAIARTGEGVLETLTAIMTRTVDDLSQRYRVLAFGAGESAQTWARQAVLSVFGTESLRVDPETSSASPAPNREKAGDPEAPAVSDVRTIRVATPNASGASDEARDSSAQAETYATACAELATALTEATGERDVLRQRLEDMQRAVAIGRDFSQFSLDAGVRRALCCLAEAGASAQASFLLTPEGERGQAICLPPFDADPLLSSPAAGLYLRRLFAISRAQLETVEESVELRSLLGAIDPRLQAVALVPLAGDHGVLGWACLYFLKYDTLPGADSLRHLASLADLLAVPLAAAMAPQPGLRVVSLPRAVAALPRAVAH